MRAPWKVQSSELRAQTWRKKVLGIRQVDSSALPNASKKKSWPPSCVEAEASFSWNFMNWPEGKGLYAYPSTAGSEAHWEFGFCPLVSGLTGVSSCYQVPSHK